MAIASNTVVLGKGISLKAKAFYKRLKVYADDDQIVNGITHEKLGVSRTLAINIIRELCDAGLIEVVTNRGSKNTMVYKITDVVF